MSTEEDDNYEDSGEVMDDEEDDDEEERVKIKVRTAKEILKKPLEEIAKVNEVFQISGVVARQLLRHFKW